MLPLRSILQYFWPALSNNRSRKPIFGLFESGCFTQVLLYMSNVMRKPVVVAFSFEQHKCRSACTSAQSDQHLCCSISGKYDCSISYFQSFKIPPCLCSLAIWFVFNLFENLKTSFLRPRLIWSPYSSASAIEGKNFSLSNREQFFPLVVDWLRRETIMYTKNVSPLKALQSPQFTHLSKRFLDNFLSLLHEISKGTWDKHPDLTFLTWRLLMSFDWSNLCLPLKLCIHWYHCKKIITQYLIVLYADYLYKTVWTQIRPDIMSGLIWIQLFDTLMVFLKVSIRKC